MEMASAAGLRLVPEALRNPLCTTTYGVGELIKAGLEAGVERILLGCADSGTNDGGAGMAHHAAPDLPSRAILRFIFGDTKQTAGVDFLRCSDLHCFRDRARASAKAAAEAVFSIYSAVSPPRRAVSTP